VCVCVYYAYIYHTRGKYILYISGNNCARTPLAEKNQPPKLSNKNSTVPDLPHKIADLLILHHQIMMPDNDADLY